MFFGGRRRSADDVPPTRNVSLENCSLCPEGIVIKKRLVNEQRRLGKFGTSPRADAKLTSLSYCRVHVNVSAEFGAARPSNRSVKAI